LQWQLRLPLASFVGFYFHFSFAPLSQMSGQSQDELRAAFALFDIDKDGKITEKELASVMKKLGSFTSDSDVKEMIREVDIDKNGTIDFNEFVVMMNKNLGKLDHDKEMMAAFKVFDKNGDGKINADEVRAAMKELGEDITDEEARAMVREADLDGDGQIDFQEFCKMMSK